MQYVQNKYVWGAPEATCQCWISPEALVETTTFRVLLWLAAGRNRSEVIGRDCNGDGDDRVHGWDAILILQILTCWDHFGYNEGVHGETRQQDSSEIIVLQGYLYVYSRDVR